MRERTGAFFFGDFFIYSIGLSRYSVFYYPFAVFGKFGHNRLREQNLNKGDERRSSSPIHFPDSTRGGEPLSEGSIPREDKHGKSNHRS
jgi:hypothetical protein